MKRTALSPRFVEFIPPELQAGTLYISVPYATAVHLCACGCGIKVVTPIAPFEWTVLWDGDSVSLKPSIGNWQFPCRSHYWITRNSVVWAGALTKTSIAEGRRRDAAERETYFAGRGAGEREAAAIETTPPRESFIRRLRRLLRSAAPPRSARERSTKD